MTRAKSSRNLAWAVLAACFLLGFFHRFAPATFADSVAASLGASSTTLGILFSWHFWVYTAAQIPAGMLVDRYGVRWTVFSGSIVTACGSYVLATADTALMASVGPALTGAGLSVVFVGIMKFNAMWFRPENYGLITGLTMLLATSGAILAGTPMALLLEHFEWRVLFALAAVAGLALSTCVALFVRDATNNKMRGEPAGSALGGLSKALSQKAMWPLLFATVGTNGTFYAFAGLWGVPVLTDSRGIEHSSAVWYVTAAMVVYCAGCLGIGVISDKVGCRKPFLFGTSVLAVIGWGGLTLLPWQAGWQALILYILVGAAASQVTVSFAALKESVPERVSATALAILNAGVFGASAALQPLFGVTLDSGFAWNTALGLMLLTSLVGLICASFIRETRPTPVRR